MKKLLVLSAVVAIAAAVTAQNPTDHPSNPQEKAQEVKIEAGDYVVRQQGVVWLVQKDMKTLVTTQVTLGETTVKADGSVILKDGTEALPLNEGDKVESNGEIIRLAGLKQEKAAPEKKMEK